jgi:hypothetical protein
VSGPHAGGTCGDGRRDELEEVVADDEERRMAGNGAATGLHGGGACGEVWGVYGGGKREKQGLGHGLNRTGKGGGAAPGELRPSMARGAGGFKMAFKRGEGETEGGN